MCRVALLAISGLVMVVPQAPTLGASPAAQDKPEERMICKSKPKTGTRFRGKTCRTAAQWEQIAEQNKRDAAEMIDRPVIETRRE